MKPKFEYEKGITLISLVVTIIVLIILAGVSINLTLGENGIITVAKRAKENVELAEIEEQKALNDLYLEIDNANNETPEEVVIESGIWRAKKSTSRNATVVEIYVYSTYYTQTVPDTLNEYKEQYIVKTYNEMLEQNGMDLSFDNFDEMFLFFMNETEYTSINDYIAANSIDKTREEFIVETSELECETSEYANAWLEKFGYTAENIAEIETEYEECKNNQNIIEIPDEIKTATYVVTYPDGTTEEVLGSDLNSFKGTYNVQDNGNNIITIKKLDEVTRLEVAVSNLMKTYTDDWYIYKYYEVINGYAVTVKDNTLTTYGEIKSDINGIPITCLYGTYEDCSNLTSLSLKNIDTSNVTDMSFMFYGCSSLTSLDISNFDTSKVTDMHCMFDGCSALRSLNVSNFNTSKVTDMNGMFSDCSLLTSLDLSNFDTSKVTDMSFMFSTCTLLTSLNVSNFNTSKVTNMKGMFHSCSSLTSLDLRSFDTNKATDMSYMFFTCTSLTKIYAGPNWITTTADTTYMFNTCGTSEVEKSET